MSIEPCVDAFDMERVLAFWEEPKDFVRVESIETNCAVETFLLAPERSESKHGQ